MSVTQLASYQNKEMIEALERLLIKAKTGQMKGLIFSADNGEKSHVMGVAGSYQKDSMLALSIAARMVYRLNKLADQTPQKSEFKHTNV